MLQVNRTKIFRAVQSAEKNPAAEDLRGKFPSRKTNPKDIAHLKEFIVSLPCYASSLEQKSTDIKYFHPILKLNSIYNLYKDKCIFQH